MTYSAGQELISDTSEIHTAALLEYVCNSNEVFMILVRRSPAFVSCASVFRESSYLELSRMQSCRRRVSEAAATVSLIENLAYDGSTKSWDARRRLATISAFVVVAGAVAGLFDTFYRRVTKAELDEGLSKLSTEIKSVDTKLSQDIKNLDTKLSKDIKHLETKMELRFGQIDTRFGQMDARLGQMDAKMDARFGQIDAKIDRLVLVLTIQNKGGANPEMQKLIEEKTK